MAKHRFKVCKCGDCPVCNWDAAICTKCNCTEGTLPTDCPETKVDGDTQDRVFTGETDFKGGKWIVPAKDAAGRTVRVTHDEKTICEPSPRAPRAGQVGQRQILHTARRPRTCLRDVRGAWGHWARPLQ